MVFFIFKYMSASFVLCLEPVVGNILKCFKFLKELILDKTRRTSKFSTWEKCKFFLFKVEEVLHDSG